MLEAEPEARRPEARTLRPQRTQRRPRMGEDQHRGGRAFPAVSSARNDEPETIGLKLSYALSEFIRIDKSLTFNLSTLNHKPSTLFPSSAQEGVEKWGLKRIFS